MRNVVIPNPPSSLPFRPVPLINWLSCLWASWCMSGMFVRACGGCQQKIAVGCGCPRRLSGHIIRGRWLFYSVWWCWLHWWPTHTQTQTHTHKLCLSLSIQVSFPPFPSICQFLNSFSSSNFAAPHIIPTLEHTQQGLGSQAKRQWVEKCGKCHPSDNEGKKCHVCVC